jgi:hypothetical protein
MDQRICAEPEQCFWEMFAEDGPFGTTRVTVEDLHVFGSGMHKYMGRSFAEKRYEVL